MKIFNVVLLIFLLCLFSCKDFNKVFGAGSYSYAEKYTINREEHNVIKQIEKLKSDNDLIVPKFVWNGEKIELNDKRKSHWYDFYIYLKNRNQMFYFWTRSGDYTNTTIIALVAVRNGLGLGNWKDINKDLSDKENKEIKKVFEEKVISKIPL